MSLSDRLQQARTQQLIESGVLPADHTESEPVSDTEPELVIEDTSEPVAATDGGLFAPAAAPVTIEVQPVGLHLVSDISLDLSDDAADETEVRCPNCKAPGVVDMVDLVGHTVHYTCGKCSTMWQVRKPVVRDPVA